jgi:hypothetical protein
VINPALLAAGIGQSALRTRMALYLAMDEPSGTVYLDSASGVNPGAGHGTLTRVSGKVGAGAAQFDGSTAYIDVASNPAAEIAAADMSISAWVNPTTPSALAVVAGKTIFGNNSWALYLNTTKFWFQVRATAASGYFAQADANYVTGTWVHLIGIRQAGVITLYVNGAAQTATGTNTEVPATSASAFVVGAASSHTAQLYAGQIDEVGLWSRALTAAEIAYLAGGGRP